MTHFLHTQADLARRPRPADRSPIRGLQPVAEKAGAFGLRRREAGFAGLCAIVCGQQLSTASAAAIRDRLFAAFDPFHHDTVRKARTDKLKRLGLSAPKIKSIREIGKAVAKGQIDLDRRRQHGRRRRARRARSRCTASARGAPTSICCSASAIPTPFRPATSPCRRRRASPSACASGRTPKALTKLAEAWRPWRGVAAHLLWAYYHAVKKRDGVPVQQPRRQRNRKDEQEEIQRKGKSGMADLDGPLDGPNRAALGQGKATRRVPARLRRRRQRPDRHRPRLAGPVAGRRLRLAARAAPVRPGADRAANGFR